MAMVVVEVQESQGSREDTAQLISGSWGFFRSSERSLVSAIRAYSILTWVSVFVVWRLGGPIAPNQEGLLQRSQAPEARGADASQNRLLLVLLPASALYSAEAKDTKARAAPAVGSQQTSAAGTAS